MNEKAKQFMEALQTDKELEGALKEALEGIDPGERMAEVVKFAQEKGFDLSEADLIPDEHEVSLGELDNVAGGTCYCSVAGGGGGTDSNDGKDYVCVCAVYGQGGDGSASDANCACIIGGAGEDSFQCSGIGTH